MGGGTGLSASPHPPPDDSGGPQRGEPGRPAAEGPEGTREGSVGGGKGVQETRRTAAELGVGSGQQRDRLELTQIRAQNDRDPEALATYGRK